MREQRYPFDGMEQFFDQMRREMFGPWGRPAIAGRQFGDSWGQDGDIERADVGGWDAGISVEETDDGFVVLADLPGFDRDELSLRLDDDVLSLSGEHEVDDGTSYRSRRVSERIALPARADPDGVSASYHNGVLEVRFVVDADEDDSGTDIHIE
ncbi:Hsp20/alpha crystallin family protein [Haloarcula onubensis]|uniref:Hsp20/alpha crystallin family protein n=1 Tax=Haloarcula onubensis TaxID=2950539 RepID=A0ABU2FKW1_9EURY|nr:Hsp20/alpha crystallin family protein [Halomicroarcula sp. S3CR25-11]MDS0281394.1 Hsp20/alpha crystallin family protein [Halomicroarcula sp. S3CR25-11]